MTNVTVIANPWLLYNLQSDPFFQEPLTPETDADYPVGQLFVGRELEVQQLGAQILGATSSRAVVQGSAGVGKTSVVHQLQVAAAAHGVLTHVDPVRIVSTMTATQFSTEVLRTLLQIRAANTVPVHTDTPGRSHARKPPASRAGRKRPPDTEAFWRRLARILEGEDTTAIGLTVASVGGSIGPARIAAERPERSFFRELKEAFRHLGDGTHRVLVHVNNLENMTVADTAATTRLLQDVRDVFLMPHSHWVFVGAEDVSDQLFTHVPQLSGIVPLVLTLDPLSPEQVEALLEKRYQYLRRGIRFTPPVEPAVAAQVYRRYHGDLRNFFRLLSRAAQHHAIRVMPEPMTEATIVATMVPLYFRELLQHTTEADLAYLRSVVAAGGPDPLFRVSDLQAQAQVAQSTASDIVERWHVSGMTRYAHTSGKSIYYRLSGDTQMALGAGW